MKTHFRTFHRSTWIWYALIALAVPVLIGLHLPHLRWVAELSAQGTPAPARDAASATGYALGQAHFLGSYERGETYRWIAEAQSVPQAALLNDSTYQADTLPEGRPRLEPRLYVAWLALVSGLVQLVSGEPFGIAAELAALWEPVLLHVLAFIGAVVYMARRYGLGAGAAGGAFMVLFPPVFGQFLPGVLGPRTSALLLATYAIAVNFPRQGPAPESEALRLRSAVAASLALWLDPAIGFPAVLVGAAAGAVEIHQRRATRTGLKWALVGSAMTLAAWLIDQNPWDPAAGELRYVHPVYAAAWIGLGLGLHAWHGQRGAGGGRSRWIAQGLVAVALIVPLFWFQLKYDYKAWFYPSVALRRVSSLSEYLLFEHLFAWFGRASLGELVFVSAPFMVALGGIVYLGWQRRREQAEPYRSLAVMAVVFAGLLLLTLFRVRWGVVLGLVSVPALGYLGRQFFVRGRGVMGFVLALYFSLLFVWQHGSDAHAYVRPSGTAEIGRADVEALAYRAFSHWMATHTPRDSAVLAPPELSDSLVFHGNSRVLMSTAWESYRGQVAASRLLSAQESSEAEAVLAATEVTHLVLPSWDRVLPLLVREPAEAGRDTLYDRLERWVLPLVLRPVPYHLPATPTFLDQKLAVFAVTDPQDQALALSRLAEYFLEMNRPEPAGLVAEVLASSYPEDNNAIIARALVHKQTNNPSAFAEELERLVAAGDRGRSFLSWDRRVQSAIALASGGRWAQARQEVRDCLATASRDDLFALTPLQAHRLRMLIEQFRLSFEDRALSELLVSLGSEYAPGAAG